jgi:hypothetical protein
MTSDYSKLEPGISYLDPEDIPAGPILFSIALSLKRIADFLERDIRHVETTWVRQDE